MSAIQPDAITRVNEFLEGSDISGEKSMYLGDRSLGISIQTELVWGNYGEPCDLKLKFTVTTREELAMNNLTLFVYEKGGRLLRSGDIQKSKTNRNEHWVNIFPLPSNAKLELQLG